jgi:type I restriction enzyme S subunit
MDLNSPTATSLHRPDLPALPADWRWVQFADTCDRVSVGHVGPTTEHFSDAPDGILFLRSQNVRPGKLELETALSITPAFHRTLKKSQLRPGDILFVRVGANRGDCCVVPDGVGELNCANIVFARPKEPTGFHAYFFQSALGRSLLLSASVGAAQGVINTGSVATMPVPLPPLPIQKRIAGILSAYDELIENSQRRIKILESMARALYREWFVHFRFPGHETVPRVPSPLGDIPRGWEVKKLGDAADTFRGRSYRSVDLADEGGLPFLNLKCLDRDGGFRRSGLKRYRGEFKDIHIAKKGDIIMAVTDMTQERRIVARAALVPTLDNEFGIFSMDLVRIEPKPALPKAFLYSFLRYSTFADEVKQHANGANVLHLSPDRITEYRFAAPPSELMSRFARFVAPVLEEIDTLANKIDNLRSTRDLLLPRLLSGQLDVEAIAS